MQWKDSGDTDSIKEESEKDYYEEEYSSFKKKKFDNIISKLFNLTEMPFGLIGIGLSQEANHVTLCRTQTSGKQGC